MILENFFHKTRNDCMKIYKFSIILTQLLALKSIILQDNLTMGKFNFLNYNIPIRQRLLQEIRRDIA